MDAVSYIKNTYTIMSDISPKNYAKLARNNIDGKLYVLKYLKVYDIAVYESLKKCKIEGISGIYEVMASPGGLYIVEEYIEGENIDKRLDRARNSGVNADALLKDLIMQLLGTLQELHNLRPPIIHRDIKPDNIMVNKYGRIKLIDFNISRGFTGNAERDTFAMGTSSFAAPEQYGFLESDPRTDIYGVGATTKYLMEKYGISSPDLNAFVDKATAFDPDNRFENAGEALYFLSNYYQLITAFGGEAKSGQVEYLDESSRRRVKKNDSGAAGYLNFSDSTAGTGGGGSGWKRFLPPGYRSGNTGHIVLGSFGYLMMLAFVRYSVIALSSQPAERKGQFILAIIIYVVSFLSIVFFSCDYLGVQRLFGLQNKEGKEKRKGIIMVDALIIGIILFIGAFLVNKV